ncbi:MAG: FTR1 family protein, partial [Candidatus Thorarchaeota archaeon]
GLTLAIGAGLAIHQGSLKVSLKAFFKWTSVLLVLFAAGMMAYGIHELQEAGLLLIGPLEVWNINPPQLPDGTYPLLHEKGLIGAMFKALFGYNGNPSALEVIVYSGYLVVVSLYYLKNRRMRGLDTNSVSGEKDNTIST